MGEYINYKGEDIKLGTCENLYYVSFPKYLLALQTDPVHKVVGNLNPEEYIKPDSGFRFRFPFPDEDHLALGDIGKNDFVRGVPITMDMSAFTLPDQKKSDTSAFQIEIVQQKLIHRESDNQLCLVLVYRNPENGESYRVEDEETMNKIAGQILKYHIFKERDIQQKAFFRTILRRIIKGYRLCKEQKETQEIYKQLQSTRTILPNRTKGKTP